MAEELFSHNWLHQIVILVKYNIGNFELITVELSTVMEDRGIIKDKIYYIKTTCVITGGILVHLCLGSFYIFGEW